MRLPWQRRVAERVEVDRPDAPAPARNAWRTVPALNAGMDTKPPLTAQSVELADDVSRRLRSTGERPRLIHRAGLPEPAAAGTVRGLATASVMSQRSHVSRFATGAPDDDSAEVAAADRSSEARASTQMVAARRRSSALTAVDATLAATLERSRAVRPEPRVEEEVEPVADVVGDRDRAQAVPPPGLQRTVIRRRPSGTPRPLGLQAPLPPDDTRQQAVDDARERRDEHARTQARGRRARGGGDGGTVASCRRFRCPDTARPGGGNTCGVGARSRGDARGRGLHPGVGGTAGLWAGKRAARPRAHPCHPAAASRAIGPARAFARGAAPRIGCRDDRASRARRSRSTGATADCVGNACAGSGVASAVNP